MVDSKLILKHSAVAFVKNSFLLINPLLILYSHSFNQVVAVLKVYGNITFLNNKYYFIDSQNQN